MLNGKNMEFNVLKPFDYFFYRNYIFFEKKKDMPFFSSVLMTSMLFASLTSSIWLNLQYVMIIDAEDIVVFKNFRREYTLSMVIVAFAYFIGTYFLYKKRKEKTLKDFKNSKYNRIIPYWVFPTIAFISFFLGLIPAICLRDILEEHNMEGIVFRWLFS